MKRLLFLGLVAWLALGRSALAQPAVGFTNNGVLTVPPTIDATYFFNNGTMDFVDSTALSVFDFSDVLYYFNKGLMVAPLGFLFDTETSDDQNPSFPAVSFTNTSSGVIVGTNLVLSGVITSGGVVTTLPGAQSPQIRVSANTISSAGTMHVGLGGLIRLTGNDVFLRNGIFNVDGVSSGGITGAELSGIYPDGVYDDYWAVGSDTNQILTISSNLLAVTIQYKNQTNLGLSSLGVITTGTVGSNTASLTLNSPLIYAYTNAIGGDPSNLVTSIVLLDNSFDGPNVTTDVRLLDDVNFGPGSDFPVAVVEWISITNLVGSPIVTNMLFLTDDFGTRTNGRNIVKLHSENLSQEIGYSPTNYTVSRLMPPGFAQGSLANDTDPKVLSAARPSGVTNDYAAYGVSLEPSTAIPDPLHPLQNFTNTAGRIEIQGNVVDLTHARLLGANYISITASNQFVGASGAQITAPATDLNLGSTNGLLDVTNLVTPFIPQFFGSIGMYSSRWTNVTTVTVTNTVISVITNRYCLLMVQSELDAVAPSEVQNFALNVTTNLVSGRPSATVYISDVLNVASNLFVVADQVTITTNLPGAASPSGQINLFSDNDWGTNFPTLRYLTNFGVISLPNVGNFFEEPLNAPYVSMVNHGGISVGGADIRAHYFENTGTNPPIFDPFLFQQEFAGFGGSASLLFSGLGEDFGDGTIVGFSGPIFLTADTAVLGNGEIAALAGDIDITATSLSISNHALEASGALNLVIGQLDPAARLATNTWQVSQGFSLTIAPSNGPVGDLMGTTLTSISGTNQEVVSSWAGRDVGNNPAGFTNNAALGHLVLNALDSSSFFDFSAATPGNAIYVDLLELQNFATNRVNPDLTQLNIDLDVFGNPNATTNMVIYFADAQIRNANGTLTDIAEKLNHANNDRLRWVRTFNDGLFSSIDFAYPSGQIYQVNRALVESTAIDSDGDGIPNAYDTTPFGSGAPILAYDGFTLSVQLNQPAKTALISWPTTKGATNHLEFKASLADPGWTGVFVTNSPVSGVVTVSQPATNSANFYRVRSEPLQQ